MFIEDYVTLDAHTATTKTSLARAHHLMQSNGVRHVPVLDENCRLAGLRSNCEVRFAVAYDVKLGAQLTVAETMVADPTTIEMTATLDDASLILHSKRYDALPNACANLARAYQAPDRHEQHDTPRHGPWRCEKVRCHPEANSGCPSDSWTRVVQGEYMFLRCGFRRPVLPVLQWNEAGVVEPWVGSLDGRKLEAEDQILDERDGRR